MPTAIAYPEPPATAAAVRDQGEGAGEARRSGAASGLRALADGRHRLSASPDPNAKPFVEVGDVVRVGQTILIVEAMKHMNEVAAPRAGRVADILVEDGQPVEYGQPLMIIE